MKKNDKSRTKGNFNGLHSKMIKLAQKIRRTKEEDRKALLALVKQAEDLLEQAKGLPRSRPVRNLFKRVCKAREILGVEA